MENYFNKLPREFRSKNSILAPLVAIGIALFGLVSIVAVISENYDIRNFAAPTNLGNIPAGCFYLRGDCTGPTSKGATGSCKPILVCPTATPTPTEAIIPTLAPAQISCKNCLEEKALSLCLNIKEKLSSCSTQLENIFSDNKVCVPCVEMPSPTPTLSPSPTLTPQPSSTPTPPVPTVTLST